MADDFDVEAMLEAPYRKEVGHKLLTGVISYMECFIFGSGL